MPITDIDFVDASPTAHRNAINQILIALGGPEHPMPPDPISQQTELAEVDPDDPFTSLVEIRRALIVAGIGIGSIR